MANNATLTTLVQADIDALDGTQTLDYLTELKVAAVKLGMATTAIDTRLDALDMSAADTATLMENAVANKLSAGVDTSLLKLVDLDSARIAAGASGDILSVTAGAGQYLKIIYLLTGSANGESGMTLTIDGSSVFSGQTLTDYTPSLGAATNTNFGVCSQFSQDVNPQSGARLLTHIYCTSFTLTKDTGTTAFDIDYAYETLEKF